jgi:hypothetical protein
MSALYWFILGSFVVWRITHLLNAEDGPGEVFAKLRRLAGSGFWGELLDCFCCLSLWVAGPCAFLIASQWRERLLLWLALSGAAILLDRTQGPAVPRYVEDPARHENETGENQ